MGFRPFIRHCLLVWPQFSLIITPSLLTCTWTRPVSNHARSRSICCYCIETCSWNQFQPVNILKMCHVHTCPSAVYVRMKQHHWKHNVILYWSLQILSTLLTPWQQGSRVRHPRKLLEFSVLLLGTTADTYWHKGLNFHPLVAGWTPKFCTSRHNSLQWLSLMWQAQTLRSWGTVGSREWRRQKQKRFLTKW